MSSNFPSEDETQFIDNLARTLLMTLGAIKLDAPSDTGVNFQSFDEKNKSPPKQE